jgi:hypothetical protein
VKEQRSGSSTAPFTDGAVQDVQLSHVTGRRQAHPVLSPVLIRLLLFVVVALAFSGFVKQLVYAVHWLSSTSGSRAS